ncbi:MAG TPA: type II CAAX endopeptidase family protein [Terriglobales bacterium]
MMTDTSNSRRQVVTYLLLVAAFSSVFYFLILRSHRLTAGNGMYVLGIMWCPGLAAMATVKFYDRSLSDLGWKWPQAKYAAMSWYVPLMYATIAYLIVWASGLGGFPNQEFLNGLVDKMGLRISPAASGVVYVLLYGTVGMVRGMSSGLGEEIGWRGFLVPELFKTCGFTATAFISGIVWACWHYPGLIWADYNAGTPTWYGLTCFTVMVVADSFILAWLRLKSGSLWTGAILHGSHNLYIQLIFSPLTRDTGRTKWFIDEFGAVLPLVTIAFAIYFWRRRGELVRE